MKRSFVFLAVVVFVLGLSATVKGTTVSSYTATSGIPGTNYLPMDGEYFHMFYISPPFHGFYRSKYFELALGDSIEGWIALGGDGYTSAQLWIDGYNLGAWDELILLINYFDTSTPWIHWQYQLPNPNPYLEFRGPPYLFTVVVYTSASSSLAAPAYMLFDFKGEIEPIPEPSTLLLIGSGLIGLAGYGRRKFFKK